METLQHLSSVPILGISTQILELKKQIKALADEEAHVLFKGPKGTEAPAAARMLFDQSDRAQHSNFSIDAETWNENKSRIDDWLNSISLDSKATLIVYDIQDLAPELETRLYEYMTNEIRVEPENHPLNLRIICSMFTESKSDTTKITIHENLKNGFEHIVVFPSICDRPVDIPVYLEHFLRERCTQKKLTLPCISFELFRKLFLHTWPENLIGLEKLADELAEMISTESYAIPSLDVDKLMNGELIDLPAIMDDIEKDIVTQALKKFRGKQIDAAVSLGITPPLLRYKMRKYKLYKQFGKKNQ